jgi:TolA-binding protein
MGNTRRLSFRAIRKALFSQLLVASCASALLATSACSSAGKKSDGGTEANPEHQKEIAALQGRIQELEAQLKTTNDKLDAMKLMMETANPSLKAPEPPTPTGILGHPADGVGARVEPTPSRKDPEGSFVRDQAVQTYRQAITLMESQKYPEAVLAFSGFLERHPDHPLAGAAQYHIGKCYMEQGEFKLASAELERVLTSYDRSSHVTATLRDLADAKDALKLPEEAAKHRQMLTSLFPQSPAAVFGDQGKPSKDAPTAPTRNADPDAPAGKLDEPPAPTAPSSDAGGNPAASTQGTS